MTRKDGNTSRRFRAPVGLPLRRYTAEPAYESPSIRSQTVTGMSPYTSK